mmetsp:Transcript_1408/g.4604  ORF Transcript_1408/g.4604 Transcript_1408/m.4604 type:complete len:218 (-) Transcript_1408:395-1048(-)
MLNVETPRAEAVRGEPSVETDGRRVRSVLSSTLVSATPPNPAGPPSSAIAKPIRMPTVRKNCVSREPTLRSSEFRRTAATARTPANEMLLPSLRRVTESPTVAKYRATGCCSRLDKKNKVASCWHASLMYETQPRWNSLTFGPPIPRHSSLRPQLVVSLVSGTGTLGRKDARAPSTGVVLQWSSKQPPLASENTRNASAGDGGSSAGGSSLAAHLRH